MADATKLRLPILAALAAVSTALSIGAVLADAKSDIKANTETAQELKRKQEAAEREHVEQRLRIQRLEDAFTTQNDMVKEIRQDVKDLKRGGR